MDPTPHPLISRTVSPERLLYVDMMNISGTITPALNAFVSFYKNKKFTAVADVVERVTGQLHSWIWNRSIRNSWESGRSTPSPAQLGALIRLLSVAGYHVSLTMGEVLIVATPYTVTHPEIHMLNTTVKEWLWSLEIFLFQDDILAVNAEHERCIKNGIFTAGNLIPGTGPEAPPPINPWNPSVYESLKPSA